MMPHNAVSFHIVAHTFVSSVKAIRFLSYNARWEAKMQRKRQRREEKLALLEQQDKARKEEEATRKKTNPFASTANTQASGGLGGALFGNNEDAFSQDTKDKQDNLSGNEKDAGRKQHSLSSNEKDASHKKDVMSDEESEEDDEDDSMAEELAVKASLQDKRPEWEPSDWSKDAPAYVPALYLSTFAEPSAAARQESEQKRNKAQLHKLKQDGLGEMKGWEAEKYESMMAANDPVFEKFVRRVGYHGKQLVRYEFGGVPIPFHAKGKTYQRLWPKRKPAATLAGVSSNANEYSAQSVPSCPKCGGRRVFELQLMPNLVNELRPSQIHGGADGEQNISAAGKEDAESKRRREIEEALGRKLPTAPDADGISRDPTDQQVQQGLARRTGIKWSTAMVFVCEADCHDSNISAENSWSEELVELQSEHDS